MLLVVLLAPTFALLNTRTLSRSNHFGNKIGAKEAVCFDGTPPVLIPNLADTNDCPAKYIALYKQLPSATDLTSDLTSFQTECLGTICAKQTCIDVVNAAQVNYNEAFKTSFRTNCIPTGAKTLPIDVCRNGDESVITTLTDAEDCLASYDALIAALPDTAKKLNMSFLSAGTTEFAAFMTKCLKSVCNKEDCYTEIVKKSPVTINAALKTTLNNKCNPHPPPAGDEGIFTRSANAFFLGFGYYLTFIILWL
jgi:hypothetical protein